MSKTKAIGPAAVLVVIGVLVIVRIGSGGSKPGDPAVYQRIDGLTSCSDLQSEFNAAEARHGVQLRNGRTDQAKVETSYMTAADNRMRTLGCHR